MLHLPCWHCSTTFVREEGLPGAVPRYCSTDCAETARRERKRLRVEDRQRKRQEAHQAARRATLAARYGDHHVGLPA